MRQERVGMGGDFEAMLSGGHPNSLGRTEEVVTIVLGNRVRLRDLYECWFSDDELVRLRVASAMKRVTIARPAWVMDFMDGLQGPVADIDQASTQWTLALVFDLTRHLMTERQRERALEILQRNLAEHDDWIVLNNSMKVLGKWAKTNDELAGWLRPHAERLASDPRKSVAANATKLLGAHQSLRILPANRVACGDLERIFGERGQAANCQCQRYKLAPGEAFSKFPVEVRVERLREQTSCGQVQSTTTSGLVAFRDGEPVGWCAVQPRPAFGGLVRNARVPWDGRDEDRFDPTVWAVTCIFVRSGHRRQRTGKALVRAAVDHAREHGARAIEGYPMTTASAVMEELHVGTLRMFTDAGFVEVGRPTERRAVVRMDFS